MVTVGLAVGVAVGLAVGDSVGNTRTVTFKKEVALL